MHQQFTHLLILRRNWNIAKLAAMVDDRTIDNSVSDHQIARKKSLNESIILMLLSGSITPETVEIMKGHWDTRLRYEQGDFTLR